MTTVVKNKPKVKKPRSNQRAILETPIQTEAPPEKRKGGRKSTLQPVLEQLQANPGTWFIIAEGKIGTVYAAKGRLVALAKKNSVATLEAETHTLEDDKTQGKCYARVNE